MSCFQALLWVIISFVPLLLVESNTASPLLEKVEPASRSVTCLCSEDFTARYDHSDVVVRAEVRSSVEYEAFPGARAYDMLTAEYEFLAISVFKGDGLKEDMNFTTQGFLDDRYCGVKLAITDVRTLFLNDPRTVSKASAWKQGVYIVDTCRVAVDWEPTGMS